MAKISVDIEGVLFTRGRLIDSMNFKNTGELVGLQFGDLGVQTHLPLIERYSPLACSIADHIHWEGAKCIDIFHMAKRNSPLENGPS